MKTFYIPTYLKLHEVNTNAVCILNYNDIIVCLACNEDNRKYTKIFLNNGDIDMIMVNESPEKIFELTFNNFNSNPFIFVHDNVDNSVILINKLYISVISTKTEEDKKYASITLSESPNVVSIYVNELPEKIYQMLISNTK